MVHLEAKVKTPISAASRKRSTKTAGFTLIELLVAFSIGALLVSLGPPAYNRLMESARYREALRQLITDLREARDQAHASGQWVGFEIDLTQPGYRWNPQSAPHRLHPSLSLRVTTGADFVGQEGRAVIHFLPDGGSSGGTIDLVRHTGEGARIRIDWLTGFMSQQSLQP